MANIIKIPCGQNQGQYLLPFSDISNIKTYCTPHNFTYSMSSSDHEWGEYTPHSPSWATTNYWMNENFVPNSSDPTWSLTDNGTTVHLRWTRSSDGSGTIIHNNSTGLEEFTCYIVGKNLGYSSNINRLLWTASGTFDPSVGPGQWISLFDCYQNKVGISYYNITTAQSGSKRITPDSNRNFNVFAFKWRYVYGGCPCTLNVDGTSESFQIPSIGIRVHGTYFPAYSTASSLTVNWDIKLIAFLNVAEPDEVIANNVNILRTIYQ